MVVVMLPIGKDPAGMAQRCEQRLVEALIAKAAIEAFGKSVLGGFAGGDVMPVDHAILSPFEEGGTGELSAVVADTQPWLASPGNDRVQFSADPGAGQGRIGDQGKTFAREVIHDRQDPEPAAITESIADKIH